MKTKLNILIILSAMIISFIACKTTAYINSRDIIYSEWKTANYTFIIDSIANEKGLTFYPINQWDKIPLVTNQSTSTYHYFNIQWTNDSLYTFSLIINEKEPNKSLLKYKAEKHNNK